MGLYLCVFDDDEEVDGVEIGAYSDFDFFRSTVTETLEGGVLGSAYPTLILHSDSDGQWSPKECLTLKRELEEIAAKFVKLPPVAFRSHWQKGLANSLELRPKNLCHSFIDIDGEPLIDRLVGLCNVALERNKPILFQ